MGEESLPETSGGIPDGALYPYQYELIWDLMVEPRSADELAHYARWQGETAQSIAARLRPLVKRGWLYKRGYVYIVSRRALDAISW